MHGQLIQRRRMGSTGEQASEKSLPFFLLALSLWPLHPRVRMDIVLEALPSMMGSQ